ncbi:MAG TPA: flagellar FliJ family protein [Feifaniaceae bacterium]|nr:flagellar FliJ family protein [Feifaniaceae bacterium]
MKKFAFTLQGVNDIALATEKQLKIEMQRITDRLRRVIQEIEDTQAELRRLKARCLQLMRQGKMDSQTLVQYERYFEKLEAALQILQQTKLQIEREKEKCLQAQIENRKELKTLEKLRDRQYEEYLGELRREEEKEIGDLVAFRSTIQ